jgi:hypothetical protein
VTRLAIVLQDWPYVGLKEIDGVLLSECGLNDQTR